VPGWERELEGRARIVHVALMADSWRFLSVTEAGEVLLLDVESGEPLECSVRLGLRTRAAAYHRVNRLGCFLCTAEGSSPDRVVVADVFGGRVIWAIELLSCASDHAGRISP